MQGFIDRLYPWVIKKRNPIVTIFKVFFALQTLILIAGSWSVIAHDDSWSIFYDIARDCGEWGIIFFILTCIPGIVRRFGKFNKLVSILMIFRRYIGIAMYLFALIHASVLRIVPWLVGTFSPFPVETFVVFGVLANVLLFSLFITSNDWSVKKLGIWWDRIHDLTYTIVWIIFIHVALQEMSIWSLLIGGTALLQATSHIYARRRTSIPLSP